MATGGIQRSSCVCCVTVFCNLSYGGVFVALNPLASSMGLICQLVKTSFWERLNPQPRFIPSREATRETYPSFGGGWVSDTLVANVLQVGGKNANAFGTSMNEHDLCVRACVRVHYSRLVCAHTFPAPVLFGPQSIKNTFGRGMRSRTLERETGVSGHAVRRQKRLAKSTTKNTRGLCASRTQLR